MKFIPEGLTRTIAMSVLKTKKNSPHIFFAGGIAGVVTSTVLACKATLKLEETVDEIKNDLENVNAVNPQVEQDDREHMKDVLYVYGKSVVSLGRLYGPAVLVGAASIGALTGSHIQMTRRNSALTITLAAVSKAYDDYRERVADELGKDKELDIYHAAHDQEIEGDGKKKQIVKVADASRYSPYARFFDEGSTEFRKDAEWNRYFIQAQQNYFNQKLQARGHVFLNEVYDALGLERSTEGCVVGWVREGNGDGFICFGLYEAARSAIDPLEPRILLDFNVDGVVYDKI